MMSREWLPLIGSSGSKTTASSALQRPQQVNRPKRTQPQKSSSSSSHHHLGPSSILVSDTAITPWGGLAFPESSFTSLHPPLPPPPPTAPQPKLSTPYHGRPNEDEDVSSSSFTFPAPSPPDVILQDSTGGGGRGLWARQRLLPQRQVPRPHRLPPLRPVTNLSFSRSFTFSFFELPHHQSAHCRAERIRNLTLLLRQIHY